MGVCIGEVNQNPYVLDCYFQFSLIVHGSYIFQFIFGMFARRVHFDSPWFLHSLIHLWNIWRVSVCVCACICLSGV